MSEQAVVLPRDDSLPGTLPEFMDYFSDEARCVEVLRRWKYPDGFLCSDPTCGGTDSWYLSGRRLDECTLCGRQTSLTSGTVMHSSKKPLRLWFAAMFLFVVSKQGISAMDLKRQLGVSYPTAWSWLQKLRGATGDRVITRLSGFVEMDETWVGGPQPGVIGRPHVGGKKSLVAAAIEVPKEERGFGRVRLSSLPDGSAASFREFLASSVAPGSTLLTDDWLSYRKPAQDGGYEHIPTNVAKAEQRAHEILPGVHRVFSLLHRILLTTYQGAVSRKHLPLYLAEFEFRFNRRNSASRGLLFQRLLSASVMNRPQTYRALVGTTIT